MNKSFRRIAVCLLAIAVLASIAVAPAFAKTKTTAISSKKVTAAKSITFNDSPYSKGFIDGRYSSYQFGPFQNFAYTPDGKHIFAMNIAKKGKTQNSGLICYKRNGKTAQFRDGVVLKYYGHSDVLAVTQPDLTKESYYVWVAKSKVKKPKTAYDAYGKIIERITFSFDGTSDNATVSDKIEITKFPYSKVVMKNGKRVSKKFPYGSIERVSAAANQTDNRIAFRLKFYTGQGTNYVIYDLNKLSNALDKAVAKGKTTYDIRNARNFQISNLRDNAVPLDGFQSFDVDKNYLYVAGYTTANKKYNGGVYKIRYDNTIEETGELGNLNRVVQNIKLQLKEEFEGIKIERAGKKTLYHFNTIPYGPGLLRWGQILYKLKL